MIKMGPFDQNSVPLLALAVINPTWKCFCSLVIIMRRPVNQVIGPHSAIQSISIVRVRIVSFQGLHPSWTCAISLQSRWTPDQLQQQSSSKCFPYVPGTAALATYESLLYVHHTLAIGGQFYDYFRCDPDGDVLCCLLCFFIEVCVGWFVYKCQRYIPSSLSFAKQTYK